jgi:iron complex transport system permease protein
LFGLRTVGLLVGVGLVGFGALLSLRFGSLEISTADAWNAVFHYNPESYNETVVRTLRVPRTVIALAVGAGLAVAGGVMQAVTRNPLAGPSILGVSAGASFAVVTAIYYFGLSAPYQFVWFAFGGSFAASALVFVVASTGREGPTPVKLALAGVVVSTLLGSWTTALILLDQQTNDIARFWLVGSVAGRDLDMFWQVAPFLVGGTAACILMAHQLNVMSLGEDAAKALGMRTARVRLISALLVVLITGAAVSAAGPIGFVGLAAPHMVRSLAGPDYRWVLPYAALAGALLVLGADILGRLIARPSEIQVGIVTAMLGAPFFIYLARKRSIVG